MMFVITCLTMFTTLVAAQERIELTANKPEGVLDLDQIKEGIAGRIIVYGDVPKLPPLVNKGGQVKGQFCGQNDIPDESFIVSEEGGLANVFVYLKRIPEGIEIPANEENRSLHSIDCRYVPHVQVIQTDQQFSLVNTDAIACNFHIPGFNNAFNLMIPAVQLGEDLLEKKIVFQNPERFPIIVQDDIYAWKKALILPLDHPFAAVTDKNGNFIIQGLPPGSYDFTLWHEKIGYLEKKLNIEVRNDEPTSILLSYPSKKFFNAGK